MSLTQQERRNVPFYRHQLTAQHAALMTEVMCGPHLTYGAVGKRVEGQLRRFFQIDHALLTNSWSGGALAALQALGIGPGDEVIVPAMTFVASANIPLLLGAQVKLVDVCPQTLLLDPDMLAQAITPKTRAVICVHLYGQMCDMPGLRAVCDVHGAALIEDCAHAFEATRGPVRPGALGDAAIFSFYATKNISCGEGGAVITTRADLAEKIQRFRSHGMSASAADRFKRKYYQHWDVAEPGMKASLPDLLACVLAPQIDACLVQLEARQALADRYRAALSGLPVTMPVQVNGARHAQHLFPICVVPEQRDIVIAGLNARGVGCTVNYRALQDLELFEDQEVTAPNARTWGAGTLCLPLYPGLTLEEQDHVIAALADALAEAPSLISAA